MVTYFEWSGEADQNVVVPWTVIDGPESAIRFRGQTIGRTDRQDAAHVHLGRHRFRHASLGETSVAPLRKVIDVSGDGPNSSGRPVVLARDEAASLGVTINGLPIMLKRPIGLRRYGRS